MYVSKQKLVNRFHNWNVFDVQDNKQYVLLRDFSEKQDVPALVIVSRNGAYVSEHPTKNRWISRSEYFAMLEQDFDEFRSEDTWIPLFTVVAGQITRGDARAVQSFAESALTEIEAVLVTLQSMVRPAKEK